MYIIYKLYAKSDLTKSPKYVGITASSLNKRLGDHISESQRDNKYTNLKRAWIKSVLNRKDQVLIEPIGFAHSQEEAFEKERFFIDKYIKEGFTLKNGTSGGEGSKQGKIKQFSKDGTFIKLWDCIANIEQELGIQNPHISGCCRGRRGRKIVGGFVWRYEKDNFNTFTLDRAENKYAKRIQRKVYQIDAKGNVVKIWNHSQEIENELGFDRAYIAVICRNPISQHKQRSKYAKKSAGFHWAYESNKDIVQSLLKGRNTVQVDN